MFTINTVNTETHRYTIKYPDSKIGVFFWGVIFCG
jgi:hypothetical protein